MTKLLTNLFKTITKAEMGARANMKIIEMKTKEVFNKPVMKTKVITKRK